MPGEKMSDYKYSTQSTAMQGSKFLHCFRWLTQGNAILLKTNEFEIFISMPMFDVDCRCQSLKNKTKQNKKNNNNNNNNNNKVDCREKKKKTVRKW